MGMREKDQADFDLEAFVDLFDTAMNSDNPAVQRALKNLILVSAIVNAQENPEGLRKGPLRRMVDDVNNIVKRLNNLESQGAYRSTYAPTTTPGTASPAPGSGTWTTPGYIPGSNQWPTVLPGTFPPGTIISGQSVGGASFGSSSVKATNTYVDGHGDTFDVKVGSLLNKLESK